VDISQQRIAGRFERAIVGLHLADSDAGLLAYVAMLLRAGLVNEVLCVHVSPGSGREDLVESASILSQLKEQTRRHLETIPVACRVAHEVRRGPLLDNLLVAIAEHQSDVAIIGHQQEHPLRRSLARRLAKLAPCSIWLVPDQTPAAITRMLAPIDFSPAAGHSLQVAAALAEGLGLHEVHTVHIYFDESRTTYEGHDAAVRGKEESSLATFVGALDLHGVRIVPHFHEGSHPEVAIRQIADELTADLVVIGTRGRSPSAAVLLGSVAQETLVASRVPVLVVRVPGAHVGLFRALMRRLWRHEPGVEFES
jgi:nucleotide-binding universal stress UspA family protein